MSGAAALTAVFLLATAVALLAYRRRAAGELFARYAKERGMTLISSNRARLPDTTPLLRAGEERFAERLLEGPLGEGFEGQLANYTYLESGEGAGDAHRFTVGYLVVPESVPVAPELFVRPRSGPSALQGLEDALAGPRSRIELESQELAGSHEIFASEMQDRNRLRQLFSPSFVLWLTEEAPPGFGFELFGGKLCCRVDGHATDAETLDRVAAATVAVATRLRDEALENVGS